MANTPSARNRTTVQVENVSYRSGACARGPKSIRHRVAERATDIVRRTVRENQRMSMRIDLGLVFL